MVITLHPTIHDSCITLFPDAFPRNVLINPVGISPHGRVNFTKLHRGTRIICDCVLETLVEVSVVQKHVRVMVEAVEMSLDRLDGLDNTLQLFISGKNNKGRVRSPPACIDLEAPGGKHLIVFFTDFSVSFHQSALGDSDHEIIDRGMKD